MSNIIDLSNKSAFLHSQAVSSLITEICMPLKKHFGIKAFGYLKIFKDSSYLNLNNGYLDYQEKYFSTIFTQGKVFTKMAREVNLHDYSYHIWPPTIQKDYIFQLLHAHDIWHGCSIYNRGHDYLETFAFAFDCSCDDKTNFFINNIGALEKFSQYFKEAAKNFIDCSDKTKLAIYKNGVPSEFFKEERKVLVPAGNALFLKSLKLPNNPSLYAKFSPQESNCIKYIAAGKTSKEIGKILNISYRTVESYLAHAKNKIGCSYKSQLIEEFYNRNETKSYV